MDIKENTLHLSRFYINNAEMNKKDNTSMIILNKNEQWIGEVNVWSFLNERNLPNENKEFCRVHKSYVIENYVFFPISCDTDKSTVDAELNIIISFDNFEDVKKSKICEFY